MKMKNNDLKTISHVGVIGAGTMGSAIAQHFCMKNLNVILVDVNSESLNRGRKSIEDSLSEAVQRRIMTEDEKKNCIDRINFTDKYENLTNCQYVVEAVFEDFNVKKSVFSKIEENVSSDCVIASNTSSFPITELGKDLKHQERFLGIHYFYHAAKNKLVEIIPGKETSADFTHFLNNFYFYYDKLPIIVKDVPGFAVNRFFVPWLNEAVRLLEEGSGTTASIDKIACEIFNVGMGPFALMNATGVPIAMHAAQTLADAFGPFYAPAQKLKEQVETGKLWEIKEGNGNTSEDIVKDRLIGATLGVAAQMVSEGVTTATDADLGARIGLRWPMGPFEMMNNIGIEEIVSAVKSVFTKWDLPVPEIFTDVDKKAGFQCEYVRKHIIGSTAIIEFNRPDSMNALNEAVMSQLAESFDSADSENNIDKIIFFGRGKAFVAGADIKFFVDNIDKKQIDQIYKFTDFGQKVLLKISGSKKDTIAFIDGLALGGGLELALACKYRVGTGRTTVAFPETGIGIYPGLGGTQRTPRLIGKGPAKFLVATGRMINAEKALAMGLIDAIIERVEGIEEISKIEIPQRKDIDNSSLPENEFESFSGTLDDDLFQKDIYKKYEKQLKSKAPLALKKAMELIDEGENLKLEDALQLELNSLDWIFNTKDAREGLGSVLSRKKPAYTGQ